MSASLVPSFLLTLREALEAVLIVAIVASYLKKTGKQSLNKYLFQGAVAAIIASVLLGLAILAVYGGLADVSAEVFEGVDSLTATAVLTYMILWMTKHAQTIKVELERKVETAVWKGQLLGIVALSFVAVFREGLETVLFLTTLAATDSWGTLLGVTTASVVVIFLAVILTRGMYRLDIKRFFQVTSIILIIFAAGLAAYGVHELIEAGESAGINIGVLGQHAFDINPPRNTDGTYPLLHEKGAVGAVFAALVGYDGNPEWLRVIAYCGYWLVLGIYFFWAQRRKIAFP
jgi:high-affinity iron transporter